MSEEPIQFTKEGVLRDYRLAYQSRQASLLGRREVLTGKAKFGIFGGGKEVAQVALAHAFQPGDHRAGYYRDQTLMLSLGITTLEELFAQLFGDTDQAREPASAGRQMNCHFASRLLTDQGTWKNQTEDFNSSADLSPTGSQMPRLVGLAYASRLYRDLPAFAGAEEFSRAGNEIAFGTIGDASCAEGLFWEAVNAAGVLKAPMLLSIWDDGYGISVPTHFQVTKGNISTILRGFQRAPGEDVGFDIYTVKGWDYPSLCQTYLSAAEIVRREHVPAIIHVTELNQPQGHSTSGSHERYKSKERLLWEDEIDCLRRMRRWILDQSFATERELSALETEDKRTVTESKQRAWTSYRQEAIKESATVRTLLKSLKEQASEPDEINAIERTLDHTSDPLVRDLMVLSKKALVKTRADSTPARAELAAWQAAKQGEMEERYSSHLLSNSDQAALKVQSVPPVYSESSPKLNGFDVLNGFFDAALQRDPKLVIFGEDVGNLGDVNQGLAGLQDKYGELRVADTGIREATILGQAIGLALRGFRPIAEVQYLDYVLYALQIISDDLATLRWRTSGGQKAPVIVRTRGHRLEGVWHSGSPMAGILNLVRGIHLCVPRNMTQAAGMYNTLLMGDDPGIVVEVLNSYRVKEILPANIESATVPLGVPEMIREGTDITLVTYGACCRIALDAAELLDEVNISTEIIDVRTLLPFDLQGSIADSIRKTSRVLFLDEDVPGGASAYMLQQVLEVQGAYSWLDAPPRTVTAREHRPAYGSDGDYFSKPGKEEIFDAAYRMMYESDPVKYPMLDA
jgi:pyruvate/2-oxoglutarate/acetoin dehydrogenase E1 component/TPP-dependent pyruvate/acetoin dehydrogenase alpha subunit